MKHRRTWFMIGALLAVLGLAAGYASSSDFRQRAQRVGSRMQQRREEWMRRMRARPWRR